jgi:23S rRNA (uracil1939-C5)-methyltransferase
MRSDRKKPPPFRVGELVSARIETLPLGPDSIARARGYVLFVPGGIPGETVRLRVTEAGRRFGRAEIVDVLERSPERAEPFCPLYLACGGCHLQHLTDAARRRTKARLLERALEHALGRKVPVSAIAGEAEPRAYRDKVAFTVAPRGRKIIAGFYRAHTHDLIEVPACPVQNEEATRAALALVRALEESGAPAWDEDRATGDVRHVLVRAGARTGDLYGVVVVRHEEIPWLDQFTEKARSLGLVGLALNVSPMRERDLVLGPETRVLFGPDRYRTEIAGITYHVSPTSFFQTNATAAEAIIASVLRFLGDLSGKRILDVYGGVGLLALQVAKKGGHALVVEGNPASIADGRASAAAAGLEVSFRRGRAEDVVPRIAREGSRFDGVILDPPREGCHPRVIDTARRVISPPHIVYVSCDVETLARDLTLFNGYTVDEVAPIDMFPHAYPIEVVVSLTKR